MIDLFYLFFIVLYHSFVLIFSFMCIVSPKDDKLLVEGDCIFYCAETSMPVDGLCLGVCLNIDLICLYKIIWA